MVWVALAALTRTVHWSLAGGLLANAVTFAICLPLMARFRHVKMPLITRRWYDIPLRASLVATLVAIVVTLSGWVHSRRDLGGLIFIDIRDREGRTQTVFDPSHHFLNKAQVEQAAALRGECVVSITGEVRQRPAGTNNDKIPTGEIEVAVQNLEVLNMAEVLPFPVDDPEVSAKVNEELRLMQRPPDVPVSGEVARELCLRAKRATKRELIEVPPGSSSLYR